MSFSPLHRLLTIWKWFNGFDLIFWPRLAYPSKKLEGMSLEELNESYRREYNIAVEQNQKAEFALSTRGELAIDRCVLLVTQLSILNGGPSNHAFMKTVRGDLLQQIELEAKRPS